MSFISDIGWSTMKGSILEIIIIQILHLITASILGLIGIVKPDATRQLLYQSTFA